MQRRKRHGTPIGIVATAVLAALLLWGGAPRATGRTATAAGAATSAPPGAPMEDIAYANEWPAPNGDLYNTRVAHTAIAAANVAALGVAWTLPVPGHGSAEDGLDFANPVVANGVAYLQDGASNVAAVRYVTGQVLWTHVYNSPSTAGPNGLTIAGGRVYGVTDTGVFALDAQTGRQVWYDTQLGTKAHFNTPPQVAGGKVFVSSDVTVGGVIYALDAGTGAVIWSFQTVVDQVDQRLQKPAGGAWDAFLIGPDHSVYVGIGNPYLSQQQAQAFPSRELYTDSLVKLDQATGKLEWYFQATPDDFHDWDLQVSPIYTAAAGRPVVLAAGKGGFVFAFDPSSGKLLWKASVGIHNGHDDDGQLALEGKLRLTPPYRAYPGEIGGVETNMAAADGVVYVPVVNAATTFKSATAVLGTPDIAQATGELDAIDIATGKQLWATKLAQMPLGGATVANDLVFTTTLTGEVVALARQDGALVWTAQLPAGSNATLAITGSTLLAGAGLPLTKTQHPAVVAYQLGAKGTVASPTGATSTVSTTTRTTVTSPAQAPAQIPARMPNTGAGGMSTAVTLLGAFGIAAAVLGVGGGRRVARRRTRRHPRQRQRIGADSDAGDG